MNSSFTFKRSNKFAFPINFITTQVIHARSDPVGSVEFRRFPTTGFRSGFRRTRSDQFPPISDEFLIGILRNLPEIFRWKPDRNPLVRKSSEFNGTDRKATDPMGSDAGNDRIHWSD